MEGNDVILYVEDSADDYFLFTTAVVRTGLSARVVHAVDGEDAIAYLEGRGAYADRTLCPLPCLIVTDLKMPRVDGFELLTWLKSREQFREIPAIVLSSSARDEDRQRMLNLGARAHFVKPCGFIALDELVRKLMRTWIAANCVAKS